MAAAVSPINCVLLLFLFLCPYHSKVHGDGRGYEVLRVETLMPATVCSPWKAPSTDSLKLVHRHGPCSPSGDGQQVDHLQILSEDARRVAYIQSIIQLADASRNMSADNLGDPPVILPMRDAAFINSPNGFTVTVGIGTPKRDQTVSIDTGSSMCWIQCSTCETCFDQVEPKFNPSNSSSYRNITSNAQACSNLPPGDRNVSGNNCGYRIRYDDGSGSTGLLAMEALTLTNATKFPDFFFGCGQNNTGFRGVAGLFGLGRKFPSLLSQAPSSMGGVFSHCLPTSRSTVGHLTIGRRAGQTTSYTPMLPPRPIKHEMYFIDLVGITVGSQRLQLPATVFTRVGTVLDSGTMISRLPAVAYSALRNAFRSGMQQYRLVAPVSILDTCYDFSNVRNVLLPTITLHFAGSSSSTGVNLALKPAQVFYWLNASATCLGFAANSGTSGVAYIGAVQQRGIDVIYDIGAKKIGFAAGNCGG